MNDVDRRVARLNPVLLEDVRDAERSPEAVGLLEGLLDQPIPASRRSRSPGLRHPRGAGGRLRLPVFVGVALVLAGSAIGWAITTTTARDTVNVQCLSEGGDTIIPAVTGDPVADCAAQWRRDTGSEPPPLVAYDNGHGGITVAPADRPALPGASPLPDGATQNVAIVQVQRSLDDLVGGLNSGCFDNPTAIEMTTGILARFGMQDWTVDPAPPADLSDSSAEPCVGTAILDPAARTVSLRALGGAMPSDTQYSKLASRLRSLSTECMPLDVMADRVGSILDELGISEAGNEVQLTEIPENDAPCATVTETVGGSIFLVLRGPAAP
jgi:hypothetical protein